MDPGMVVWWGSLVECWSALLLAVLVRLGGVPSALEQRVRAERRPEVLEIWLKAALAVTSLEALLAAMGPE